MENFKEEKKLIAELIEWQKEIGGDVSVDYLLKGAYKLRQDLPPLINKVKENIERIKFDNMALDQLRDLIENIDSPDDAPPDDAPIQVL